MDTLSAMKVFCSVVENDSLAGAARLLNVSPSVVSKQLSALEDRLGVRLINRTTRRVSVTEEGQAYYERSKRIIADVDEAEIAISRAHSAPRGLLKVTAPFTFSVDGGAFEPAPLLSAGTYTVVVQDDAQLQSSPISIIHLTGDITHTFFTNRFSKIS